VAEFNTGFNIIGFNEVAGYSYSEALSATLNSVPGEEDDIFRIDWEPDGTLRRRPSYFALKALSERLEGWRFLGPAPSSPGVFLYRFQRARDQQVVAWATRKGEIVELPGRPRRAVDRSGDELARPPSGTVTLGPSPVYFELDSAASAASESKS
jgi:hypothetical protein